MVEIYFCYHLLFQEQDVDENTASQEVDESTASQEAGSKVENRKDKNVLVTIARTKKKDGNRVYDSSHACAFCGKEFSKIARHISTVHSSEPEISSIAALTKKERAVKLEIIRNRGDFIHNLKVLQVGGELKVCRRPLEGENVSPDSYTPCPTCFGFFLKAELWRHSQNCVVTRKKIEKGRKLVYESSILLYGGSSDKDKGLWDNVIATMKQDDITELIKKDELITSFGSFIFASKGKSAKWYISQRMRILARLLKQLNSNIDEEPHLSLIELMKPSFFDDFVSATKELCTLQQGNQCQEFKIPSLALKIGYAMKKACVLGRGIALRKKDKILMEDLQYFIDLIESDWSTRISSVAIDTLNEKTFNSHDILPVTEDLIKLKDFIVEGVRENYLKLRNEVTPESFRSLEEFAISRILTFNKRRCNEACKVTIDQFNDRHKWKSRLQEVTDSLQPLELELTRRLVN